MPSLMFECKCLFHCTFTTIYYHLDEGLILVMLGKAFERPSNCQAVKNFSILYLVFICSQAAYIQRLNDTENTMQILCKKNFFGHNIMDEIRCTIGV